MKYIFFWLLYSFILVCLSIEVFADQTCTTKVYKQIVMEKQKVNDEPPQYLKDATIIVKLTNGKEVTFSSNEFKVVKRVKEKIVKHFVGLTDNKCIMYNQNRLSVMMGHGRKDGLTKNVSSDKVDISNQTGPVLGLQYQRNLTDVLSIGIQVQSNKTNSLMLGVDF